MPELPAIETKSSKRSGRAKTDEIGHKYNDTNGTLEKIMSVAKTNSKVYEPKTYEEVIMDPIHSKQYGNIIEEKIQNLENHQT